LNLLGAPRSLDARAVDPGRLGLAIEAVSPVRRASTTGRRSVVLQGKVMTTGLPDGLAVLAIGIHAGLSLPGGVTVRDDDDAGSFLMGWFYEPYYPMTDSVERVVARTLNATWVGDPSGGDPLRADRTTPLLELDENVHDRFAGTTGVLRASVTCEVFKVGAIVSIPLRAGAAARVAGAETTLLGVEQHAEGGGSARIAVRVRHVRPQTLFPREIPGVAYALVNRARGEVVFGGLSGDFDARSRIFSGQARIGRGSIVFSALSPRAPLVLAPGWLDQAELVLVTIEPMGTFTKTVHVPDFVVPR
jgi:hypothetical protein